MQGCNQDYEDETEYENMDQAQKVLEMHLEGHRLSILPVCSCGAMVSYDKNVFHDQCLRVWWNQ